MTALEVVPLQGLPLISAGDDLVELIASALKLNGITPRAGDVLVVAQKIVSKAEGRYGDLLDGYVMDLGDAGEAIHVAPKVTLARTLMTNLAEREELARVVLEAANALASLKRGRDFVA